jgi:hypothetical protein
MMDMSSGDIIAGVVMLVVLAYGGREALIIWTNRRYRKKYPPTGGPWIPPKESWDDRRGR